MLMFNIEEKIVKFKFALTCDLEFIDRTLLIHTLMKLLTWVLLVQAILPLRGKILNIERRDEAAMYKNEEIQNLILALGLGVKVLTFFYSLQCSVL